MFANILLRGHISWAHRRDALRIRIRKAGMLDEDMWHAIKKCFVNAIDDARRPVNTPSGASTVRAVRVRAPTEDLAQLMMSSVVEDWRSTISRDYLTMSRPIALVRPPFRPRPFTPAEIKKLHVLRGEVDITPGGLVDDAYLIIGDDPAAVRRCVIRFKEVFGGRREPKPPRKKKVSFAASGGVNPFAALASDDES
jgi:hypothetical protein